VLLPAKERAKAEEEARRRGLELPGKAANPHAKYQADPIGYSEEVLGVVPWAGRSAKGQRELFEDIAESVRLQLAGELRPDGTHPPLTFRVEAGHGVGKTFGAAVLVNWFHDAFAPSIIMTTAPSKHQVVNLLWKDIKKMRARCPGLTGRVLPSEPRMEKAPDHWAIGQTTSDSGGTGAERFQGQHDELLFFVLDEAEGVPAFVFDAIGAMMTGGRVILCLMLANPKTRSSRFHKAGQQSGVMNYRLSVLDHPNVLDDADTVKGATGRRWVDERIDLWCEAVDEEEEDNHTFSVPWRPGIIYQPNTEFMFRVMGVAPANVATNTLIALGRYEAACKRTPARPGEEAAAEAWGYLGCDVAGFGNDYGTLYARFGGVAWRAAQLWKQDYDEYARRIRQVALEIKAQGCTHLSLRIDAGGGFGQGVLSHLKKDAELSGAFPGGRLVIHEVHFGVPPKDRMGQAAYADLVTQLYAEAAETIKGVAVRNAPNELEADLCERTYDWTNQAGVEVKRLEPKKSFRARHGGRSPDDGDGFVLCAAPEYILGKRQAKFF
jgi:hypothetical protein